MPTCARAREGAHRRLLGCLRSRHDRGGGVRGSRGRTRGRGSLVARGKGGTRRHRRIRPPGRRGAGQRRRWEERQGTCGATGNAETRKLIVVGFCKLERRARRPASTSGGLDFLWTRSSHAAVAVRGGGRERLRGHRTSNAASTRCTWKEPRGRRIGTHDKRRNQRGSRPTSHGGEPARRRWAGGRGWGRERLWREFQESDASTRRGTCKKETGEHYRGSAGQFHRT
mmetsp:Transcript_376/g.1275  ORF Transcript_376/g.1275 Transcript_376/m.1275 type:complete len:227 (+) Transcript_376:78-758(+)